MSEEATLVTKLTAVYQAMLYRPVLTVGIILLSFVAAVLEGIGLSFLLPIIEIARGSASSGAANGAVGVFIDLYRFVGVPFKLEYVVGGVMIVMTVRYTSSFLVAWLRAKLRAEYIRYLQETAFDRALDAEVSYFDAQGSDEILNAIVTQTKYAGGVIERVTKVVEIGFLSLMYLSIAVYLAPALTVLAVVFLGGGMYVFRSILESGYDIGDRVADANEQIQESVQAGMQGIRDVKLFGLQSEIYNSYESATRTLADSTIKLHRNKAALNNIYQLSTVSVVFLLIYGALRFTSLSLAAIGVFLFAMFRLAPQVSKLNNRLYNIEGELPHLLRTQRFIDELTDREEPQQGGVSPPQRVETVSFDDVSFAYDTGEQIFNELSLQFDRGEFVAFVGPSGAGKSTIVSLLTRMYEPDSGDVRADGTPISEFDLEEWRSHISVVRQHPFIFNETLRDNITVGDREATQDDIDRVCEIAHVTEFIDDLPEGYGTVLGDDGVRLSGGQKQRVALARALLRDADLLILDEATSDLDSTIEEEVQAAIESMERDFSVLVIAHRLSTVTDADRIYAIEDGQITESGMHGELLRQGGTYAELYETQTETV